MFESHLTPSIRHSLPSAATSLYLSSRRLRTKHKRGVKFWWKSRRLVHQCSSILADSYQWWGFGIDALFTFTVLTSKLLYWPKDMRLPMRRTLKSGSPERSEVSDLYLGMYYTSSCIHISLLSFSNATLQELRILCSSSQLLEWSVFTSHLKFLCNLVRFQANLMV